MPHWLLTSTFYGQWLPGDRRGSVTNVRDQRFGGPPPADAGGSLGDAGGSPFDACRHVRARVEHSRPGEPFEPAMPALERSARARLKGPPVVVDLAQAEVLLAQLLETAAFRGWTLEAISVMVNHVHLIVEAPPEVGKSALLRDFKSYGARRLNRSFAKPASGTWWSDGGSCRIVTHLASAIFYVCHRQPRPLVIWIRGRGRISPEESDPRNVFGE